MGLPGARTAGTSSCGGVRTGFSGVSRPALTSAPQRCFASEIERDLLFDDHGVHRRRRDFAVPHEDLVVRDLDVKSETQAPRTFELTKLACSRFEAAIGSL